MQALMHRPGMCEPAEMDRRCTLLLPVQVGSPGVPVLC